MRDVFSSKRTIFLIGGILLVLIIIPFGIYFFLPKIQEATYRADTGRTGFYQTTPLVSTPSLKWKIPHNMIILDFEQTDPLSFGNYIYAPFKNKNSQCSDFFAFDKQSHEEKWALFGTNDWCSNPTTTPMISKGTFVYMDFQTLFVIDMNSGKEKWKVYLNEPRSSPIIKNNAVFILADDGLSLYSFDLTTGKQNWETQISGNYFTEKQIAASDKSIFVLGVSVQNADNLNYRISGNIYILDLATGVIKHKINSGYITRNFNQQLISPGNPFYMDGIVYFRINDALFAYDENTGKKVGAVQITSMLQQIIVDPAAVNKIIYAGGFGNRFFAIDQLLTKRLWTVDLGAPIIVSPVIAGNYIYTATAKEVLALSRTDGHVAWRYPVNEKIESQLLINDGSLYFLGENNFYALH